jgi:hypothetical protein
MHKEIHELKPWIVVGLLLCGLIAAHLYSPIHPILHWNLEGCVFDEATNPIPHVAVHVTASGKISAINRHFEVPIKTKEIMTTTGSNGCFNLSLEASQGWIAFAMEGYQKELLHFHQINNNTDERTNEVFKVFLKRTTNLNEQLYSPWQN